MTALVTISWACPITRLAPATPLVGHLLVDRLEPLDGGGGRDGPVNLPLFVPYTIADFGIGVEVWRGLEAVAAGSTTPMPTIRFDQT